MGSLGSRPDTPSPTVIYKTRTVTQPAQTSSASNEQAQQTPEQSQEETAAQSRTESLLRRDRGRSGTIGTSYRGLLAALDTSGQRKTLLGQ